MLTSFVAKPRDSACSLSLVATALALPVCEPYKMVNAAASEVAGAPEAGAPSAAELALAAK